MDFTVTSVSSALGVNTTTLPNVFLGVAYAGQAEATGGAPPYTWSVSPARCLPA